MKRGGYFHSSLINDRYIPANKCCETMSCSWLYSQHLAQCLTHNVGVSKYLLDGFICFCLFENCLRLDCQAPM